MKTLISKNIPTILVVLGATGDLMAKKITPALFHLFEKQQLPEMFKVVSFARRNLSTLDFQNHIAKVITQYFHSLHRNSNAEESEVGKFFTLFSYKRGFFENEEDYKNLAKTLKEIDAGWGVCSSKLFYLAVPPQYCEVIVNNLATFGLTKPCSGEEGWTRVIVEKPFGKDSKTAAELDVLLGKLFREEQIYRIDHYLGKEMLQNILAFRFCNKLFENNWNNQSIERIEIKLLEKIGVEERGKFYDGIGALRDVGQNHLLQMLALITMNHPSNLDDKFIREKRAEVLKTLKPPSVEEIKSSTFRAQYNNYKEIHGVDSNSTTETYFKIRTFLKSPRWQGVPIIMESGKRLGEQKKEVVVTFRHSMSCFCSPELKEHYKNKVIFQLEPEEKIIIKLSSKTPGLKMEIEERTFDFAFRDTSRESQYAEDYEKLLLDCIVGDQTLFVSSEEVWTMWEFVDPIVSAWQENVVLLKSYEPGTDWISRESKFIEELPAASPGFKKEIGIVGLGKMGKNIAIRLFKKEWKVSVFCRRLETLEEARTHGLDAFQTFRELVNSLTPPRIVWLMVPAGNPVDEVIFGKEGLVNFLSEGDIIIDGGNSFYEDSLTRYGRLKDKRIHFVDVGVSGGPKGALLGASLMIGGDRTIFERLEPLFYDLAKEDGYKYFEGAGAGHFVKMVHNGIEYGIMQSIAEGFTLLKRVPYKLDLEKVANIYNHGSVIESKLVGWLEDAYEEWGQDLEGVSSTVGYTGEGEWTIKTAKKLKVHVPIIKSSFDVRVKSAKKPSYTGKILSALRNQFGGHDVKSKTR